MCLCVLLFRFNKLELTQKAMADNFTALLFLLCSKCRFLLCSLHLFTVRWSVTGNVTTNTQLNENFTEALTYHQFLFLCFLCVRSDCGPSRYVHHIEDEHSPEICFVLSQPAKEKKQTAAQLQNQKPANLINHIFHWCVSYCVSCLATYSFFCHLFCLSLLARQQRVLLQN